MSRPQRWAQRQAGRPRFDCDARDGRRQQRGPRPHHRHPTLSGLWSRRDAQRPLRPCHCGNRPPPESTATSTTPVYYGGNSIIREYATSRAHFLSFTPRRQRYCNGSSGLRARERCGWAAGTVCTRGDLQVPRRGCPRARRSAAACGSPVSESRTSQMSLDGSLFQPRSHTALYSVNRGSLPERRELTTW